MVQREKHEKAKICIYEEGYPVRLAVYAIGIACGVLSLLLLLDQFQPIDAVLYGIRTSLPPLDWAVRVGGWFCGLWDANALASVIRLLGVSGVAFAWLVSAADKEILGIPIRDLLQWMAGRIFQFYFFCFIPLLVIGVYAGDSDKTIQLRAAAVFASIGVMVVSAYLMWLCYALLLHAGTRQKLIVCFYRDQLRACIAKSEDQIGVDMERMELWLMRSIKYYRAALEEKYQEESENICSLWLEAASSFHKTGQELLELYYDCQDCPFLDGVEMIEHAWLALLDGGITDIRKEVVIKGILTSACIDCEKEQKGYSVLLTGLVMALFHMNAANGEVSLDIMRDLDLILNEKGLLDPVKRALLWMFGMWATLHAEFGESKKPYKVILRNFALKYREYITLPECAEKEETIMIDRVQNMEQGIIKLKQQYIDLAYKRDLTELEQDKLARISAGIEAVEQEKQKIQESLMIKRLYGRTESQSIELLLLHISWMFRREENMDHTRYWGYCVGNEYVLQRMKDLLVSIPDALLLCVAITEYAAGEDEGEMIAYE